MSSILLAVMLLSLLLLCVELLEIIRVRWHCSIHMLGSIPSPEGDLDLVSRQGLWRVPNVKIDSESRFSRRRGAGVVW